MQGLQSIAAVMENRANEIGIAVLTPDLNCVTMTQLVDTSLYQHTLNFLKLMEVKTVIFSQSLIGTALHFILSGKDVKGDEKKATAMKSAMKN